MIEQGDMFARIAERPGEKWSPPSTLPNLQFHSDIWMDTETTGLDRFHDKPVGISGYTLDGNKWYLPWGHAGGGNLDERNIKRWAQKELRGKNLHFLNANYDNHMFRNWGIDLEEQGNKIHDVAFQAALLDERRRRFNLEQLCQDVLGSGKDQGILRGEKAHISEMPSAAVGPYAEVDALRVYELDMAMRHGTESKLKNSIRSDELERVLELENSIIYAVCEMEKNGALIDRAKLEGWVHEAERRYQVMMFELFRRVGFRVNPDSPQDMSKLFLHLGLECPKTAKGADSFEGDFLAKVENDTVQLALRIRRLASLLSKYLKKYLYALDSNNILRFSLHQLRGDEHGTISGRFSCAAPKEAAGGGANIQQVFKVDRQIDKFGWDFIVRELFIPEPGKFWVSYDAAQIEFRLFVHYSNSERLIQRYRDDPKIDFHEVVLELIKKVVPTFERTPAKTINFAKLYGAGRDSLADQLGKTREEVDWLVDKYEEEFPEAGALMRTASNRAQTRGIVKTILGRRARFVRPSSKDAKQRMMEEMAYKLHSALNRVLQGTAADIMKLKIKRIHDNRKHLGLTERLTVHDEGDGDMSDPGKVKDLEEILQVQEVELKVPIIWEVETGQSWELGKTEKIKAKMLKAGKTVPEYEEPNGRVKNTPEMRGGGSLSGGQIL